MTRKLEELFDLPTTTAESVLPPEPVAETQLTSLSNSLEQLDKIEAALPAVRGLESSDQEMDDLAQHATDSYKDLMDLGMQVDSRFASEIFSVASQMLGHAITAKNAKVMKKLKVIDLQLKKLKMDRDQQGEAAVIPTGQGQVLDRNALLERVLGKNQNSQNE